MKEQLKTLKDFEWYTSGWEEDGTVSRCYFINGKELKKEIQEEAKKWIKLTNEEKEQWIRGGSTCYSYETADAVLEFIKYFFNLEDEK